MKGVREGRRGCVVKYRNQIGMGSLEKRNYMSTDLQFVTTRIAEMKVRAICKEVGNTAARSDMI